VNHVTESRKNDNSAVSGTVSSNAVGFAISVAKQMPVEAADHSTLH
jgi:hypothetical protein